jgi:hypothetical protein
MDEHLPHQKTHCEDHSLLLLVRLLARLAASEFLLQQKEEIEDDTENTKKQS